MRWLRSHSTPASPSSTTTDRWQVPDLKLKRERIKVMGSQIQVVYRIADGTVTWSHEAPPGCMGPISFTETFSLKGAKWDIDSRITFFAPKTGRYKNRWRVDGQIGLVREKQVGICPGSGDPSMVGLPEFVWDQGRRAIPDRPAGKDGTA